jgi:hypothetical protein
MACQKLKIKGLELTRKLQQGFKTGFNKAENASTRAQNSTVHSGKASRRVKIYMPTCQESLDIGSKLGIEMPRLM